MIENLVLRIADQERRINAMNNLNNKNEERLSFDHLGYPATPRNPPIKPNSLAFNNLTSPPIKVNSEHAMSI